MSDFTGWNRDQETGETQGESLSLPQAPVELRAQEKRPLESAEQARPHADLFSRAHGHPHLAQGSLQALSVHREALQAVHQERHGLQSQIAQLQASLPDGAEEAALSRAQQADAPAAIPEFYATPVHQRTGRHPSFADVSGLYRHEIAGVMQTDNGRGVLSKPLTDLQRTAVGQFGLAYKTSQSHPVQRAQELGSTLAAIQRQPFGSQVSAALLGSAGGLPRSDLPLIQRALNEADAALVRQDQQDQQVGQLHSLQRQLAEHEAQTAHQHVLQRVKARQGAGSPLPESIQRHLEHGLNTDLSRVRVHHDQEANELSKRVHAHAFTTGSDIYFGAGQYEPHTVKGLELVAHEATHIKQQASGQVAPGLDPDAGKEQEAQQMGQALSQGGPVAAPGPVQRSGLPGQSVAIQRRMARDGEDHAKPTKASKSESEGELPKASKPAPPTKAEAEHEASEHDAPEHDAPKHEAPDRPDREDNPLAESDAERAEPQAAEHELDDEAPEAEEDDEDAFSPQQHGEDDEEPVAAMAQVGRKQSGGYRRMIEPRPMHAFLLGGILQRKKAEPTKPKPKAKPKPSAATPKASSKPKANSLKPKPGATKAGAGKPKTGQAGKSIKAGSKPSKPTASKPKTGSSNPLAPYLKASGPQPQFAMYRPGQGSTPTVPAPVPPKSDPMRGTIGQFKDKAVRERLYSMYASLQAYQKYNPTGQAHYLDEFKQYMADNKQASLSDVEREAKQFYLRLRSEAGNFPLSPVSGRPDAKMDAFAQSVRHNYNQLVGTRNGVVIPGIGKFNPPPQLTPEQHRAADLMTGGYYALGSLNPGGAGNRGGMVPMPPRLPGMRNVPQRPFGTPLEEGAPAAQNAAPSRAATPSASTKAPQEENGQLRAIAKVQVGGETFIDTNQTVRPENQRDPNKPTLISDRVSGKEGAAKASGKGPQQLPNGNMSTAHAEVGALQQAYEAGKTQGQDMKMTVWGGTADGKQGVCTYCRGDLAAMAEKSGLKSLTVDDTKAGITWYWEPGMKTLKQRIGK